MKDARDAGSAENVGTLKCVGSILSAGSPGSVAIAISVGTVDWPRTARTAEMLVGPRCIRV